jgi:hypothetical protein
MDDLVIGDRAGARILALLPAIVIAVAVRVLTLADPATWLRLVAAGGIALSAWTAYRLLTARLVVSEEGLHVRGVFYDADVTWADLDAVSRTPSALPLRLLVWGIFSPESLTLHVAGRRLRPVAAISGADDDELHRVMTTLEARLRGWPARRRVEDHAGVS